MQIDKNSQNFIKNIDSYQIETNDEENSNFKKYFNQIQENNIPKKSFREFINEHTYFTKLSYNSNETKSLMISYIFDKYIILDSSENKINFDLYEKARSNHPLVTRVILPALYSRNLFIKHPSNTLYLQAADLMADVGYIPDFSIPINSLKEEFALTLEKYDENSKKLLLVGVVNYKIKEIQDYEDQKGKRKIGYINALSIHSDHQGYKYGTLLLAAALLDLKSKGYKEVKVSSSDEGLGIYLSFGFVPEKAPSSFFSSMREVKKNLDNCFDSTLTFEFVPKKLRDHLEHALGYFSNTPTEIEEESESEDSESESLSEEEEDRGLMNSNEEYLQDIPSFQKEEEEEGTNQVN